MSRKLDYTLKPIGVIHSELRKLEDCPKQEFENAPSASLEIFPEYLEAVADLKPGASIVLLTWLDQADRAVLKTKPRDNPAATMTGVFSTRSPHRPNPIGMHIVKVMSILDKKIIKISALEVLDNTPLLDIKPDLDN